MPVKMIILGVSRAAAQRMTSLVGGGLVAGDESDIGGDFVFQEEMGDWRVFPNDQVV